MADKIPVKAKYTGSDTTALAEFESGDTLANSYLNTGTGASQLVQLDSSSRLPAVDGSQLTGIDGLPSQSGQTGKYLTTNGSAASWGTVASGGVNMTSAATAPTSPSVGDQWYDTTNGVLYVRVTDGTDAAWLDISSANGTAAAGGGGGAWEVISSTTLTSSTASVTFTGLDFSSYQSYAIQLSGMKATYASGDWAFIRVNGSSSNIYTYGMFNDYLNATSGSSTSSGSATNKSSLAYMSDDTHVVSGMLIVNSDADRTTIQGDYSKLYPAINNYDRYARYLGRADLGAIATSLTLGSTWGFDEGTFTLYGIKTS